MVSTPKSNSNSKRTPKRLPGQTDEVDVKRKKQNEQEPDSSDKRKQSEPETDSAKRKSSTLMSFFKVVAKPAPQKALHEMENSRFQPFVIKEGWTMSSLNQKKTLTQEQRGFLDTSLLENKEPSTYINLIKGKLKKRVVTASNITKNKAKYFHFHDNYRPPYYGTWQSRSKSIGGRRPFSTSDRRINYECDSDWGEQEPSDAEECMSDDEDEKDDSDIEDDDAFIVAHGYLSPDEGTEENEKETASKNETDEQRKKRLAQKAGEWDEIQRQKERRYKEKRIIPNMYIRAYDMDPLAHNPQRRFILGGVLFDYTKLVPLPQTPKPSISKSNSGNQLTPLSVKNK